MRYDVETEAVNFQEFIYDSLSFGRIHPIYLSLVRFCYILFEALP
jgi:hypothetical protein